MTKRKGQIARRPKGSGRPKKAKLSASAPAPAPESPVVVASTVAGTTTTDSSSLTVPLGPVTRSTAADNEQEEDFEPDLSKEASHDPDDLFVDDDGCVDTDLARRMTIAYIYADILKAPLQFTKNEDGIKKDQWQGKGGVYAQIARILLNMKKTSHEACDDDVDGKQESISRSLSRTITRVLVNLSMCQKLGIPYEGKVNWGGGAKSLIDLKSPEAQIICDSIEQGNSIKMTKLIVNEYRKERTLPLFGYNPIFSCYQKMKPKVIPYTKKRQGSTNPEAPWSKACHRQFAQLLVRFNTIQDDDPLLESFRLDNGQLPVWLQRDQLTAINPHRVSYWDEMHRKCQIGSRGSREGQNVYVCFPKDEDGKLDVQKGKHDCDDKQRTKRIVNVKYEKEVRLCLGVIKLKDEENNESVGTRLPAYSYTSKTVITFNDRDKYRKIQINLVRASGGIDKWVDDQRAAGGTVYQNDPIVKLKGIGDTHNGRLTALGITLVGQLRDLDDLQMDTLIGRNPRLKKEKLQEFRLSAQACRMEDVPESKDHRKEANPYLSKYGDDDWEAECDKNALVGKVCVGEMIDHIFNETKKCLVDSEAPWWVYHDALSLMTAKRSVKYMQDMGYYQHWILPEKDIFDDLPECKAWREKPVGNRPEVMPLDQSLNKDVHDGVDQQVIISQAFPENDDRRFSTRTPKHGLSAYMRVWDHHPKSHRIIHDIDQTLDAMKKIVEAKGILVDGLATRPGNRFHPRGNHGGPRVTMNQTQLLEADATKFIHPDLKDCPKQQYDKSIAKLDQE